MTTWWSRKEKKTNLPPSGDENFLSVASHELRSPLSIIKWYTEMLLDGDAGPLTVDQIKYLKTIETSNQRAIDLVRSLLNVSRLELGTFSVAPSPIRLSECINQVVTEKHLSIEERHLTVQVSGNEKDLEINLDKQLCLVILRHIIGNAIMFSEDNGAIETKIALIKKDTSLGDKSFLEDSVVVTITDHGVGILEKEKAFVCQKFFKGTSVSLYGQAGSGLGLFIVTMILEKTGGDIWFISSKDGTTFYLSFPTSGMKPKEGRTVLD